MKPETPSPARTAPPGSAPPESAAPGSAAPAAGRHGAAACSALPAIAICSPALTAVSGVSTHASLLLGSHLARQFRLVHFQVGSEGRSESGFARAVRTFLTPLILAGFLLRERPAILHLNSSMAVRPFCRDAVLAMVARILRVRVISQIHGGQLPQEMAAADPAAAHAATTGPTARAARSPHRPGHRSWRGHLRRRVAKGLGMLAQRLLQRALGLSDAVVVLSRQEQAAYRQFCPGLRIVRIPNAIDPQALAVDCSDRGAPGTPPAPHRLQLVYVGRLIAEKGLFEALDAIGLLVASGRCLDFTIAGTGEAAATLATHAHALGLDAVVHFAGAVSGQKKAHLLARSDVLLLPSYSEGLPYALLEAMASGTPAITCAVGAIPDVLRDGVHGLLVPPRDRLALARAIARLDDDRVLLRDMAAAARCRVRAAFCVDHLAASFADLYGGVLDGSA